MKSSQPLVFGIPGPTLNKETRKMIEEVQPGGFILFTRNIENPQRLRDLMDELRSLSKIEPVLTIDQEGGRVSRLKVIGKEPPNANQLRDKNDEELITRHGKLMGELLRHMGFNLNLCPVVDISFDDQADNSLFGRTWGKTPDEVIQKAGLFARGLQSTGVLSCGKHFPAYSGCDVDPHHELPIVQRSYEELDNCEWKPYKELFKELDTIMIGHALYPQIDDSKLPASLSSKMINEILKQKIGFKGIVVSDDLDMGAITEHYSFSDAIRLSLIAGNDLLLICHRTQLAYEAAEVCAKLDSEIMNEKLERIAKFKKRLAPPTEFSIERWNELNHQVYKLREDTLGVEAAKENSPEGGKRSPVEVF
ncbi:beta-N-acetylhexosaminidase [bacterium]|nr:beta-N-acetylhexosaminidase [bacterium]